MAGKYENRSPGEANVRGWVTPKYVLLWTSADKRTGDRKGGKAMVEGLLKVIHAVSPDAVALVQVSMVREGETGPRMTATRKIPGETTEW